MLCIIYSILVYYVTEGLYLLIPFWVGLIYNKHSNQCDLEESQSVQSVQSLSHVRVFVIP